MVSSEDVDFFTFCFFLGPDVEAEADSSVVAADAAIAAVVTVVAAEVVASAPSSMCMLMAISSDPSQAASRDRARDSDAPGEKTITIGNPRFQVRNTNR